MWGLIGAVGAAMIAYLALAIWQGGLLSLTLQRTRCPRCSAELQALTDGPGSAAEDPHPRSYEVFGCPGCATLVTTLHGSRSQHAYCPACRQLSLQLDAEPDGPCPLGVPPRARVRESCAICGFEGEIFVPEPEGGNVVPLFPAE